jgi:hypothetical protein
VAASGHSRVDRVELKGATGQRTKGNSSGEDRDFRDFHGRPHNVAASRFGTKPAHVQVVHN